MRDLNASYNSRDALEAPAPKCLKSTPKGKGRLPMNSRHRRHGIIAKCWESLSKLIYRLMIFGTKKPKGDLPNGGMEIKSMDQNATDEAVLYEVANRCLANISELHCGDTNCYLISATKVVCLLVAQIIKGMSECYFRRDAIKLASAFASDLSKAIKEGLRP